AACAGERHREQDATRVNGGNGANKRQLNPALEPVPRCRFLTVALRTTGKTLKQDCRAVQ
ncbi:hypothetical protein ABTF05_22755, partial [Acinetobacter baumannii]